MKERYMLAKNQGLNWQALVIEDLEDFIKLYVRDKIMAGWKFNRIWVKLDKYIKQEIKEFEYDELKVKTYNAMGLLARRVYNFLYSTFFGLTAGVFMAMRNVANNNASFEDYSKVEEAMAYKGVYKHAVPLETYSKDYIALVEKELRYLAGIKAKERYDERVSMRNIAEMIVREQNHIKEINGLREKGVNLVWIVPHANCSDRCEEFQGRLYSLNGTKGVTEDGVPYVPLEVATEVYVTTKSGKTYRNGCLSGYNCFDKDTRVLTSSGWKLFSELNGTEKFYTIDPSTKTTKWENATNHFKKWHSGKMVHISSYTMDLMTTPDHNMLYETQRIKRLRFKPANEISLHDRFYCGQSYNDCEIDTITFYDNICDSKILVRLFAYWLADGSIHDNSTGLSIAQTNNMPMYVELSNLPFKIWRDENKIIIRNKHLHDCLKQLGHSDTKYVPAWIKDLPKSLLCEFLDAYVHTDGYERKASRINSYERKAHREVFTTSKQMCADLCEIALKCGYRPKIEVRKYKGQTRQFRNGAYVINHDLFVIHLNSNVWSMPKKIEYVDYNDYVYCVEVPNHTLLVERNGHIQWCGNCRHTIQPYKPNVDVQEIPEAVIKKEREINNKQRYMERNVRKYRQIALQFKGENGIIYKKARKKAIEWNKRYIKYSQDNKVPYYPDRLKILDENTREYL